MIPYILIALVSLFVSFCCGCAAGYSVGYRQAFAEMLPIVKKLEDISGVLAGTKTINEARGKKDGTIQPPEEGDRGTP
jgi:choline dehydrogenase-like flavoprotein